MESVEAPVRNIYVIMTKVESVRQAADTDWVHLEGSRESIALPKDAFAIGDNVKISFERIDDAHSLPTSI